MVALLLTGLIAGLFYAWVCTTMWGLDSTDPQTAIKAMKPGTYLINIARGKVVDTNAMLAGLDSGKLAGACLDVTDPEPLTKGHRLWKMPNVIITPHVAGRSAVTTERRAALLHENLRRFAAGEPLMNVVDKKLGY